MSHVDSASDAAAHRPIDAVTERLDDPAVAASLVTLLDNAELLSTLVLGLAGMMERGDMIMDAVAEGVHDFKEAGGFQRPEGAPTIAELGALAGQLSEATPLLHQVVESPMARPETIELLGLLAASATEGADAARENDTRLGAFGAYRSLRDPDVQRGVGLIIEIARSLGRKL